MKGGAENNPNRGSEVVQGVGRTVKLRDILEIKQGKRKKYKEC